MGYATLVSLVFHNLPSLYPSSFCINDFFILVSLIFSWEKPHENRSFKFVAHSSLHLQFVRALLWSTSGMMPAVQ